MDNTYKVVKIETLKAINDVQSLQKSQQKELADLKEQQKKKAVDKTISSVGSSAEATISTIEKSGTAAEGGAAKTSKTDLGSPVTEKALKGRKAKADK